MFEFLNVCYEDYNIFLSLNNWHVGDNLGMLPPVSLPLDGLVKEGAEDDEEEAVEDA